ncbi:hypothetical protein N7533_005068 [Penicillium manginii]|uniref:uncharacterized protein n=1 Tax=Penicillium manginii TaxID=203109 RepID=UPI002548B9C4|nr:uncharacterized protein N7533_005068 [Penicillium manginii]KAJ5755525.1 hypothetical protein N7533_005068 [Penicillium manginii]
MSRNFIPVALAIGVGVYTGYYTFQPAFQELAAEKTHGNGPAAPQSAAGLNSGATAPAAVDNSQSTKPASGTTKAEKNQ